MLLLFLSAVAGLVGGAIFLVLGLMRGAAGQYERILALAFFAMAAAGLVGAFALHTEPDHSGIGPKPPVSMSSMACLISSMLFITNGPY